MIDHTAVNVSDLEASKRFYDEALKPLGYSLAFEAGEFLGYGEGQMPNFGVVRRDPTELRFFGMLRAGWWWWLVGAG